jgi:hypothetical protein
LVSGACAAALRAFFSAPQRDMSDSSIGLDVDGQPRCDFLVARLLRPDSGNVRSDQQKACVSAVD